MKRLLFILALSTPAFATTFPASSCSVANIRTAIALTSAGDTVTVPGGSSCTWNTADCTGGSCLHITHPISLIGTGSPGGVTCFSSLTCGAGTTSTVIVDATVRNGSIIPILWDYADSTNSAAYLKNFQFEDSVGTTDGFNAIVYSDLRDSGAGHPTLVIENVLWHNLGRRYIFASGSPLPRVVIAHSTVNGATDGLTSPDDYTAPWNTATVYGSQNSVFLENNLFQFASYTDYIMDCQYGGVYAARFNVATYSGSASGSGFGSHGYDSVLRGCQAREIYNNTGTSSVGSFSFYFIDSRGGTAMSFNNTWSGNWQAGQGITNYRSCTDYTNAVGYCTGASPPQSVGCYTTPDCHGAGSCVSGASNICDGTSPVDGNLTGQHGYVCLDQIGHGGNQALLPNYEWLNTAHWGIYDNTSSCSNQSSFDILQNRDFYNYTASFTGAAGVGSGTRAARPATCTTGVTYWSTDQGSWNNSGVGGQGVLDKCTSTNTWTNDYYHPYTYPHPLLASGFTLSTATAGTGTGTITGCAGTYAAGASYSCSVSASGGSTLSGVTGCGGSGTTTYTGTMPGSNCTVTATFQGTAATPTFTGSNRITLATSTAGAKIFYTVDGSSPTSASAQYSHPIYLTQSQTLKAFATAIGYTDSAIATQSYTIAAAKTVFSLTPTSSGSSPVPYPPDLRSCCGSNVAALEATRGTYTLTTLHNWITAATSHGSTFTYTIQGFPTWMTGLGATESAPPTDLHTSTACQNVLTGTTTTDCSMKEFVTKLAEDRTGLTTKPTNPVNCPHLDYLEIINEFNTDSASGSSTGWTGTYADLATLANDISSVVHGWCSNTVVVAGSASAIVGFHVNGENSHYDVALETFLAAWAGISGASLPDGISFHAYPARQSVIEVNMPTTLVSHSDPACTSGNTPNNSCYVAVKDEVNRLNTTATLRNAAIISWAKFLPIYSTEGGFGKVTQLGGTSTTTIGASYVAESMMAIAAQNPVNHMLYAADDATWGCYWNCGSGSSAWLFAYNQMLGWLNGHSITGTLTSTSITGGNQWSLQLDSGAAELDFCDAWLTSCTTTTSFTAKTTLANVTSPTSGSLTLTQEPVLLFNQIAAATPTFSPVAGTYGPSQSVTIATSTSGATKCYTTDGSTPTADGAGTCTHGTTYTVPVTVSSSLTLKAIASKSGNLDSSVGSAAYVINGAAAVPTFSPVAGTYTGAQSVTISSSTSGSTICVTTDGTTPTGNGSGTCTHGSTYAGPITVSVSETVKAIASKATFTDSAAGSAAYVITGPAPPTKLTGTISISGKVTIQ